MEALQAAKHLTPHTSRQLIFVSGSQSHHLLGLHALPQACTQSKHPKLKPTLKECEAAEAKLDVEGLVKAAADGIERVQIGVEQG